ncbi:MAG TPA: hypothetical protein VF066_07660 [Thermoleophilaceae bacterium]
MAIALAIPAMASALPSLAANPANRMLSRGIDPIHYDNATKCNGGKVWAGTKSMVSWLQRNAAGVNWGEYRCEMWGKHEASIHSAGRAIDWHPATMSDGHALVKLLLAPDKQGNAAALARRMGIQGIIFDCQAWFGNWDGELGDYSYCYTKRGKRKKNLDPTQAHMNHVHIELNLAGAKKRTTFWNKNISYDLPEEEPQQPGTPAPAQPQAPQQPWQGNGQTGGGQFDNSGGTRGGGWN